MQWSEIVIWRLKQCVLDGLTGGQIAAMFGITRNKVMGKINRLRIATCDETMRAGFSVGRISVRKGEGKYKKAPSGWDRWHRKNGGSVISAIQASERRAKIQRKALRRQAMANLSDFPNRVHLLDRRMDQCPWPLWGDEPGRFHKERFYCGEPSETYGSYCPAHMCQAHDSRVRGTFVTETKRAANRWTVSTGNWRAA